MILELNQHIIEIFIDVKMHAWELLENLLEASDKAASIASIIRKEEPLVELLVQEKKAIEKNNTFCEDFKTLADVLIQETVRHDLSKQIPSIGPSIYGEESNKFTNALGESVIVQVHESEEDTKKLLNIILDGNEEASQLLAKAVHQKGKCPSLPKGKLMVDINPSECGVWIDPIDATGQYIKGKLGEVKDSGLVVSGLQCVAVLIGIFLKSSGTPIMGAIVQPFAVFNEQTQSWKSNVIWGVSHNGGNVTSLQVQGQPIVSDSHRQKAVLSQSERETVKIALATKFELIFASGAGYKLLATVLGLVDVFVLSHHSIYRWDCCAVHAILRALGGGVISLKHALRAVRECPEGLSIDAMNKLQLSYIKASGAILSRRDSVTDDNESLPGIIAYRSLDVVNTVLNVLKTAVPVE